MELSEEKKEVAKRPHRVTTQLALNIDSGWLRNSQSNATFPNEKHRLNPDDIVQRQCNNTAGARGNAYAPLASQDDQKHDTLHNPIMTLVVQPGMIDHHHIPADGRLPQHKQIPLGTSFIHSRTSTAQIEKERNTRTAQIEKERNTRTAQIVKKRNTRTAQIVT